MIFKKTEEEVELLKEGGQRLALILDILAKNTKPGISTNELNEIAVSLIKERGDTSAFLHYKPEGAKRKYPAALCVSINDEIVHGVSNESPAIIKDGDVVSIDLGLTHKGLITDSAITVGVGNISKEDSKLIKVTQEALSAGIKNAKAGGNVGDIGYSIEAVANRNGFKVVEGLCGHGVGYKVHEDPYVPNYGTLGDGIVLEEGMVIAIEPMLTNGTGKIILGKDGFTFKTKDKTRSAHFEHTVAIRKNGPVILTKLK